MTEALFIAFAVGSAGGSFVNSFVFRLPRGIALSGRSYCDRCGRNLHWFELIPVISYLAVRGKCRTCKASISAGYLALEALLGLFFATVVFTSGLSLETLHLLAFAVLCSAIAIIDWQYLVIPNSLIVAGAVLGVLFICLSPESSPWLLTSSLGGFATLYSVRAVGSFAMNRESMGFGDVKLAGVIGLFSGFWLLLVILWLASVLGSLHAAARAAQARARPSSTPNQGAERLPFGSYLAVSAVLCIYFRGEISEFFQLIWI
jgi:leader peptidase (prepilin peptidase)/N-methyltransferase